jgi:hypothetical protein
MSNVSTKKAAEHRLRRLFHSRDYVIRVLDDHSWRESMTKILVEFDPAAAARDLGCSEQQVGSFLLSHPFNKEQARHMFRDISPERRYAAVLVAMHLNSTQKGIT